MKKIILGMSLASLLAFKIGAYEAKKNTSEVEQMDGFYIFYNCKPVRDYERIGTYKINLCWANTPITLKAQLINKSKIRFPNGDGLIISNNMESCDIIKLEK